MILRSHFDWKLKIPRVDGSLLYAPIQAVFFNVIRLRGLKGVFFTCVPGVQQKTCPVAQFLLMGKMMQHQLIVW